MKALVCTLILLGYAATAEASWYWPFGSDDRSATYDDDDDDEPRLSDLMEKASELIDEASDLAEDGKISEAVEKYRAALNELDAIEENNPERANKPEFSTLKTKRAYVNAAIDSLQMKQAQDNARAVAVSDTTNLEKRLANERAEKAKDAAAKSEKAKAEAQEKKLVEKAEEKKPKKPKAKVAVREDKPLTPREQAMKDIATGKFAAAEATIAKMLAEHPNEAAALNLKAAVEAAQGKYQAAEKTLDAAIMSHPRDYHAYYNMAELMLSTGKKASARRYYETGRAFGGPADEALDAAVREENAK